MYKDHEKYSCVQFRETSYGINYSLIWPEDYDPLTKEWFSYGQKDFNYNVPEDFPPVTVEGPCILTMDGYEVVGCSEWMRAEPEVFKYIVQSHNIKLKGE